MKRLSNTSKWVIALALLTFFSNLPTSGGEDVSNARDSALSEYPIDFWGGISSVFYSKIPNFPLGWAVHLLIFQVLIITISLIIIANRFHSKSKRFKLSFLIFAYLALVFGSHQTRDGLMFGLICLGFSLFYYRSMITTKSLRIWTNFTAITLLILAFSFRPWVSFSCSLVLAGWYFVRNKSVKLIYKLSVSVIIFTMFPVATVALEIGAQNLARLHTIHPEQQVISMDLAAAYCWSTNPETVSAARKALALMYLDNNPGNICESFKPINWVWFSRKPIIENSDTPTTFAFLTEKNEAQFQSLRTQWIKLIFDDPATYVQNKYMYASQVFIAGDSRYIRLLNETYYLKSTRNNFLDAIFGTFLLPWDLTISLHLLSMQCVLLFWLILVLKLYRGGSSRSIPLDSFSVISFLLWLIATVFAYIGDNGRYTYSASLALLFTLFFENEGSHKRKIE